MQEESLVKIIKIYLILFCSALVFSFFYNNHKNICSKIAFTTKLHKSDKEFGHKLYWELFRYRFFDQQRYKLLQQKLLDDKSKYEKHQKFIKENSSKEDLIKYLLKKNRKNAEKFYLSSLTSKIHANWVHPTTDFGFKAKVGYVFDREGKLVCHKILETNNTYSYMIELCLNAVEKSFPHLVVSKHIFKDKKTVSSHYLCQT